MAPAGSQHGIAYVGLLLIVAIIGIVAGTAADVYQQSRQRSREVELLWIGNQFRNAIASYFEAGPGTAKTYPQRLEDLLLDPRVPGTRRHLRRIYPDPMTGKPDWELIMAPNGGIAGVKSRSTATPIKQAGFRPRDERFADKTHYSEWEFTTIAATPTMPGAPGGAPGPRPAGGAAGQSVPPAPGR
ncbi:MAG: type II secretion system protein [Betaproteobacteria bacterium]